MAIAVQRDRLVRQRSFDRQAGRNTNARQLRFVRPVSSTLALVTSDHCALQHVVAFVDSQAPGSGSVGIQAFGKPGQIQLVRQPTGAGGVTALGLAEEEVAVEFPSVVAQVPSDIEIPVTIEIFLFGWNFSEDPVDLFQPVLPGSTDEDFTLDPFVSITVPPVFVSDPAAEGFTTIASVVKLTIAVAAGHPTGGFIDATPEASLYWRVTRA